MGLHLDVLEWIGEQSIPEDVTLRTPRAWISAYTVHSGVPLEKSAVRSLMSGIARRVRAGESHHHLLLDGHVMPPKAPRGKQATWGGDVPPVRDGGMITYAPSSALEPLRELVAKNGYLHPTAEATLNNTIQALDTASVKHQRAAVAGVMAQADETALERVQRENAEQRMRDQEAVIEDLRNDKRAWQELAIGRSSGRGTAVTK